NALIMFTLFFVTYGTNRGIAAQGASRDIYFPKYDFPPPNPISREQVDDYEVQERNGKCCEENLGTSYSSLHSLATTNMLLIKRLRKFEMKFDHILHTISMEENVKMRKVHDMISKLNYLFQQRGSDHSIRVSSLKNPSNIGNEMLDVNVLRELVAAVDLSNQHIQQLTVNFEQVTESSRQSMHLLQEIATFIEDINKRNALRPLQLEHTSSFQENKSPYDESSIVSSLNSIASAIIDGSSKKSITINNYPTASNEMISGEETFGHVGSISPHNVVKTVDAAMTNGNSKTFPEEEIVGSSRSNLTVKTEDATTIDDNSKTFPEEESASASRSNFTVTITDGTSNTSKNTSNPIVKTESKASKEVRNNKSVTITKYSRKSSRAVPEEEEIVGSTRTLNPESPEKRNQNTLTSSNGTVSNKPIMYECYDLDDNVNGIYKFESPDAATNEANRSFSERYCYFDKDGDAWTVLQRRFHNFSAENFNRTWSDYKHGFGNLSEDFWFGNDFIQQLTSKSDDGVRLRIIITDKVEAIDESNFIEFSVFKIKSEEENYTLEIDGYNGTIANNYFYNNTRFSTFDNQISSCASSFGYGWWFKSCTEPNFENMGNKATMMMIRPNRS
ncbi:Angiopoietin-4, partial [Pseudolycoriella hygida]